MSTLTVLVGLPGSGKSSSIPNDFDGFIYSTDKFIEDAAKHFNSTYNEMFKDNIGPATKHMNEQLDISIKQRADVIWDQTNMGSKKRVGVLSKFPKTYRKICVCRVPPDTSEDWGELQRRVLSREGKIIPKHIIESMADSYVVPTLDEGFDEVRLYDIYGNEI